MSISRARLSHEPMPSTWQDQWNRNGQKGVSLALLLLADSIRYSKKLNSRVVSSTVC